MEMKENDLGLFADTQGNQCHVLEYIKQIPYKLMKSGTTSYRDGGKNYMTDNGIELNRIDDNFQTLDGKLLSPVQTLTD